MKVFVCVIFIHNIYVMFVLLCLLYDCVVSCLLNRVFVGINASQNQMCY